MHDPVTSWRMVLLRPGSNMLLILTGLKVQCILGGPWDLGTTYNCVYTPTYIWGNPYKPFRGIISRVVPSASK